MDNTEPYTRDFDIHFAPLADPDAVVIAGNARFTVLTSRLLRLEYSPSGSFEDRPSQAFWFRSQSVPEFSVRHSEAGVEIAIPVVEDGCVGSGSVEEGGS